MNILALSWRDPKHPLAGGAEQVMHEHMKGWIRAGHKVVLFSSYFDKAKEEETIDGVKVIRRGDQLIGVKLQAFLWYLSSKHEHFDIVVDQFHGIPFFTPFYISVPKLAVIQEVAREVWFMNELPKPFNYIVGPIGYFAEPFIFKFYNNVVFMTGSDSAKNDLMKMGIKKNKIEIVPHGVIIKKPKKTVKKEKTKTVIFLGALTKDKGMDDMLETFSILNRKDKFKFWIIGRGSVDIPSDISKNTKFWGFVSQEKKFELLTRAHILINPSKREGWGLVNIEANSMSTPVVAYNSVGLIDSVKNNVSGVICKKNSPEELAKNVLEILNNKSKYKKLSEGALNWSKKFTWKESSKKSLQLISEIV